jgi:hypothetical protein
MQTEHWWLLALVLTVMAGIALGYLIIAGPTN